MGGAGALVYNTHALEPALDPAPQTSPRKKILIGGIPRGGTTLVLRLMGEHSNVFAWPGESSAISVVQALWANGPPDLACRAQVEANLQKNLHDALIEMQRWNLATGDIPEAPLPEAGQVEALVHLLSDAVFQASSVRQALVGATDALSDFVANFSDAPVIAEKTPSNIFAFPHLCDLDDVLWVVCHREPFGVIASIQDRVGVDPFAADWDGSLDACIGLYLRYAKRVIRALRTGSAIGACYDGVCAAPDRFFSEVGARSSFGLGSRVNGGVLRQITNRVGWRKFDEQQRWRILRLTDSVRRLLGYDERYYGASEAEMSVPQPLDQFSVSALDGLYAADVGAAHRWMTGEASFAVCVPHGVAAISAQAFVPGALGMSEQKLSVIDSAGRRIAEVRTPPDKLTTLNVELAQATPVAVSRAGRLYRFDVYAAQKCLPLAKTPGVLDARLLSCLLTDWKPFRPF